jgi:hypothetical protein
MDKEAGFINHLVVKLFLSAQYWRIAVGMNIFASEVILFCWLQPVNFI